jgi:hypothetical protein
LIPIRDTGPPQAHFPFRASSAFDSSSNVLLGVFPRAGAASRTSPVQFILLLRPPSPAPVLAPGPGRREAGFPHTSFPFPRDECFSMAGGCTSSQHVGCSGSSRQRRGPHGLRAIPGLFTSCAACGWRVIQS